MLASNVDARNEAMDGAARIAVLEGGIEQLRHRNAEREAELAARERRIRLCYYLPSFDSQWAKLSLGTVLRESLIWCCCENNIRRVDMLIGEHDYKRQYDVIPEPMQTLDMPRTLVGRAAVW